MAREQSSPTIVLVGERLPRPAHRGGALRVVLAITSTLTYLFLYLPIAVLVIYSFSNSSLSGVWGGFTLDWYRELFQDRGLMEALRNSVVVGLTSTVLSTALGTMVALALERYRFRGRAVLDTTLYLPIVIPDIVMAVMLLVFFSSFFNLAGELVGTRWGLGLPTVIIAHVAFSISFVTVVVRTSLKNFDMRLEEAAQDLGANRWQTFWRITFPLILPGVLGGALLAFTISLDDFVISFFTTGPGGATLPIEVFTRVRRGVTPEINAISTLMLLVSIILVASSQLVQRRQ